MASVLWMEPSEVGQMDELMVRVLSGNASDAEIRELEAWRAASPDHERSFARLQRVWEATGGSVPRLVGPPPPLSAILAEAARRRGSMVSLMERRRRHRRWGVGAVAAAAAVVLFAVGSIVTQPDVIDRFATGASERRTVTLADGSVVRLAPQSRLEVSADPGRSVRLEGRAFFAVVTDSTNPFTVETAAGRTEVLGTRFEVAATGDSLRLLVVEGRVALAAAGERVVVGRGEVSRVRGEAAPTAPAPVDVWSLLEWPAGLLIFQATPLSEALDEVGRHFGVPVTIANDELARRSVTAWFENEPLGEVVGTICAVVGAACEVGDTVEVTR